MESDGKEARVSGSEDRLVRTLVEDPPVRLVALRATRTVAEAARRHELGPWTTIALGRGLCAGLLMTTLTKGNERVTLQVRSEGLLKSITVDANDMGEVRGYAGGRQPLRVIKPGTRADLQPALGEVGQVIVHRDLGLKDIYEGAAELTTGQVDLDFQHYLNQSEQTPSLLRADVLLDAEGAVQWAGGILVQTTPGASDEALAPMAARIDDGWVIDTLAGASDEVEVLSELMGVPVYPLEWRQVRFHCPCDAERVGNALKTLGLEELRELRATEGRAEVTCHYCNDVHEVGAEQLDRLIAEKESDA